MLGLGLGDWVSVKVRFGLEIQGEIYTHSELLRTSGVRRGVGVNESVKKGHPGSQGPVRVKGDGLWTCQGGCGVDFGRS